MQLACFQPIEETPEACRAILAARADPNIVVGCFQPIRETPGALEAILAARAEPNIVLGDSLSPLRRVIMLARACHVIAMRHLLLHYGANEIGVERQRWGERRNADACEKSWLQNFHRPAPLPCNECVPITAPPCTQIQTQYLYTMTLKRDDREE